MTKSSFCTQLRRSDGFALVAVLWTLAILSIIAAMTLAELRTNARLSSGVERQMLTEAAFDAALNRAIAAIVDPQVDKRWPADGRPVQFKFEDVTIQISIQDEFGKIDLNAASADLLTGLFQSGGLSQDAAQNLANAVLDWRESDDLHRLDNENYSSGAVDAAIYRPRSGPFQSIAELRLVPGMTAGLFARIEPALTVYSRRPTADRNIAPLQVLLAIPGMSPAAAQTAIKERDNTSNPITALPLGQLAGRPFTISLRAISLPGQPVASFIIRLTADPRRPYWILYRG